MLRMDTQETSQDCFDDLRQHGLLHHYHSWQPKMDGTMDGLTLFGKRKDASDKTVYVKKYQPYPGIELHELDDLMAFAILRACNIAAPKVKLKSGADHHYLFSTEISQSQPNCIDRHPEYISMDKLMVRSTPYRRKALSATLSSTDKHRQEVIHLDTHNLAKFILLGLILRLCDLRASNTGILIARQEDRATAKIAIIDFAIRYQHISIPESNEQTSLAGLVSTQPALKVFLRQPILPRLDDKNYLPAFHELETHFLTACEQAQSHAKTYTAQSQENVSRADKLLQYWKSNFHRLQQFVSRIENDHSQSNTLRASMSP